MELNIDDARTAVSEWLDKRDNKEYDPWYSVGSIEDAVIWAYETWKDELPELNMTLAHQLEWLTRALLAIEEANRYGLTWNKAGE